MAFGMKQKTKSGLGSRPGAASPAFERRGWKHLGNLTLLLGLWIASVAVLNLGVPPRHAGLAEGQRAPATVMATVDFDCVNVAATELLRRQAGEAVVPVFSIQVSPLQVAWRSLEKLADRAIALRQVAGTSKALEADLAVVADLLGFVISGEELALLFPAGKELEVLGALKDSLAEVWNRGILSEVDRESSFQGLFVGAVIDLALPGEGTERAFRPVRMDELASASSALEQVRSAAQSRLKNLGIEVSSASVEAMVRPTLRPNLDYDERTSHERRTEAQQSVAPVWLTVRAGTTLMEEGMTVSAQTVEMMDAYNQRMAELESPKERRTQRLGDAGLLLAVLLLCSGWLYGALPSAFSHPSQKALMALLVLLSIALACLYRYLSITLTWIPPWLVHYALPMALPAFLAVLMLGAPAGMAIGLWSALTSAMVFGRSFEIVLLGLGGAMFAALLLRSVRRRSQVMRAGLVVGIFSAILALAMAVLDQQLLSTAATQMGAALTAGIFTAIMALLLLPFLEWIFNHSTGISLLELTDMSHPILQRLAIEAPGTYHHSLMVGAIGQAAANRIGADGLLVLVSAYFHDAGKLTKPEFFSENQRGGENPHDDLAPSMSALVIQSHVKEGLTLAKRHKLPQAVCSALLAHHGNSLTSYFYQIARRNLKDTGQAEDSGLESNYRYDGPKPATREQAILMLADTVEAASRSLEKPTPHHIAEMVETLVRAKLLDGQLDKCPLTLYELHEVCAAFSFALSNILHGRSPYPRENPTAQPAAGTSNSSASTTAADSSADAPGLSD